jgi:hypothetical protein
VTESQLRGDVEPAPQRNLLDREIARHRALAVDTRDAADAEDRAAESLESFAEFLDAEFPTWRDSWKGRK